MFDKPSAGGDLFACKDHVGALLVVQVHGMESVTTDYGTSDQPRATVTVVADDGTTEVYEETLLFGKVLASQLKRSVGRTVVGRLNEGQAKRGQNAPYRLDEASDADEARAVKAMTSKPAAPEETAPAAAQGNDDVPPWERKG